MYAIDNGGASIKLLEITATSTNNPANIIINKIHRDKKKFYVGNELEVKQQGIQVFSPIEKGLISNWEIQRAIWNHIFSKKQKIDRYDQIAFLSSEFELSATKSSICNVFLNELGFIQICLLDKSLVVASRFFKENKNNGEEPIDISIFVDSGYSETVVTVFANVDNKIVKIPKLTTRLPIGGKLITNYLKQTISYKEVHVMDEFVMIDELKGKCVKIAEHPEQINSDNIEKIEFLLPNFINRFSGRIIEDSR